MKKVLLTALLLGSNAAAAAEQYTIMAPATAGGGYDTFARMMATQLETSKLSGPNTVINVPGDGGVKGLAQFAKQTGEGDKLIVFGLTTLAALNTVKGAGVTLSDVTPIARMTKDTEVLVVPVTSKYKTWQDIAAATKAGPVKFGGASVANAGHLFTALHRPVSARSWCAPQEPELGAL